MKDAMIITNHLLKDCPDSVSAVLDELVKEAAIESIWLVGSRANQNVNPSSDWDLLVFSNVDERPVLERQTGVDVIVVGPAGQVLTESKSNDFAFPFVEMQWRLIDECSAAYVGRKFLGWELVADNPEEEETIFSAPHQLAYLIWCKK